MRRRQTIVADKTGAPWYLIKDRRDGHHYLWLSMAVASIEIDTEGGSVEVQLPDTLLQVLKAGLKVVGIKKPRKRP